MRLLSSLGNTLSLADLREHLQLRQHIIIKFIYGLHRKYIFQFINPMPQLCSMKKLMTQNKPVLHPLQFILSLVLLMVSLHEIVFNEDLILREFYKSLAVVSLVIMLAAVSNNTAPQRNDTHENR